MGFLADNFGIGLVDDEKDDEKKKQSSPLLGALSSASNLEGRADDAVIRGISGANQNLKNTGKFGNTVGNIAELLAIGFTDEGLRSFLNERVQRRFERRKAERDLQREGRESIRQGLTLSGASGLERGSAEPFIQSGGVDRGGIASAIAQSQPVEQGGRIDLGPKSIVGKPLGEAAAITGQEAGIARRGASAQLAQKALAREPERRDRPGVGGGPRAPNESLEEFGRRMLTFTIKTGTTAETENPKEQVARVLVALRSQDDFRALPPQQQSAKLSASVLRDVRVPEDIREGDNQKTTKKGGPSRVAAAQEVGKALKGEFPQVGAVLSAATGGLIGGEEKTTAQKISAVEARINRNRKLMNLLGRSRGANAKQQRALLQNEINEDRTLLKDLRRRK